MLQRVMIAGALAASPELLIADEPTTALDVTIQAEIVAIFDGFRRERSLSILFITHDLELASALCDRVLVMYGGRIMEEQPTASLFASPLHPYSAGLLGARPASRRASRASPSSPGARRRRRSTIPGCPFQPRCSFAQEACLAEVPPLRKVGEGAFSACLRSAQIRDDLRAKAGAVHG